MNPGAVAGAWLVSAGIGVTAADAAGSSGVDFAGLAALITAFSGLVATLGAIYLGSRKKPNDATEEALKLLLEIQKRQMEDEA